MLVKPFFPFRELILFVLFFIENEDTHKKYLQRSWSGYNDGETCKDGYFGS